MNLSVVIKKRDFSDPVGVPDVTFRPERYGWMAVGGPDFAEVAAAGEARGLWSLLNWLRAPIEITDQRDQAVWWGYINGVTVRTGAIEVGVSLTEMANRIAVTYSYVEPGSSGVGVRATTSWAQDDDSVSTYGTKELLVSRDSAYLDVAEAGRNALLAALKNPVPKVGILGGSSELSASLHCLGWWHTLDWTYLTRSAGLESHESGSGTQAVGEASGNQRVAQSFQISGSESWQASMVDVKLSKVMAEGDDVDDNVVVELCSDASGPGTVLASASLDGTLVGDSAGWWPFTLSPGTTELSPSTTYWLVVRRSGSVDSDNYYKVAVDEALGYASGAFRVYDCTSWGARSPDADMQFKVRGVEVTTTQIERAIDAEGQFLEGVDIVNASGMSSNPYRDGDTSALQVIRQLLENGTSNDNRLLATVTQDRVLKVYEEPDAPEGDYDTDLYVRSDGTPVDKWGNELLAHACPVAEWCALKDVIAATVNTSVLANPSPFYIERCEYDVRRQVWIPEPHGVASPWDVGQLDVG